jgi:polysaccharide export outer membrane protein
MKTNLLSAKSTLLFLGILTSIILISSCVPQQKIKLAQNKIKNDTLNEFILRQRPKNTVQPFDNLYIKVISPDVNTSNMFNSESMNVQNVNYNMISYLVNDSGYIDFPFVGLIKVKDLTLMDAKDTIQSSLRKYISEASVIVKFVGKSITVIGEVARQGEFVIYSDNINIFKALSLAGGLTDFGNRENVTIIREIDNKARYYYIDLTDKYIVQSDLYYLRPDDIVIVQPLKQKSFGFASFPYTLVLSSVTTILALLTFMRTY